MGEVTRSLDTGHRRVLGGLWNPNPLGGPYAHSDALYFLPSVVLGLDWSPKREPMLLHMLADKHNVSGVQILHPNLGHE